MREALDREVHPEPDREAVRSLASVFRGGGPVDGKRGCGQGAECGMCSAVFDGREILANEVV